MKKLCISLSIGYLLFAHFSHAEPYINTDDIQLRASIQHLKNAGLINVPTNTYPLMWADIGKALKRIKASSLNSSLQQSYDYLYSAFKKAPNKSLKAKLTTAKNDKRFNSFGDQNWEKNSLTISASSVGQYFAFKFSPTINFSSDHASDVSFEDSYLAARLGNWNISVGTQNKWWGPGWDSNIGLTNNARPIPAITLKRNTSLPFTVPFTDYQIPWNVSTFMGKMEEERHIPNTLLWGFRLNFIPVENLEISLIRLAQWGGDGRSTSFSTFFDLLIGRDNCGVDGLDCGENKENEPGNQQAGYDFRYSFNLFDMPMSFYGQYFGEDGDASGGLNFITKPAVQLGFEGNVSLFDKPTTWFIEATDTYKTCGTNIVIGDCFFEHHIYTNGMRYKGRNIGHLYDNDAESLVAGLISQTANGLHWDARLRYVKLNIDNSDRYPNDPKGNSVTEIAEDLLMLSINLKQKINQITYKVGIDLSHSSYQNNDDEQDINLTGSLIYLF